MAYDNSGTISKNDRKVKDNHPDIRGKCTIDGREFWISGWLREGSSGKFYSLAFQPKDEQASSTRTRPAIEDSDEIPF